MRIAQLANFIGPGSGGMRVAVDALGSGYAAAGAERLLVVPGPVDTMTSTPAGEVVQIRAPRVAGGYRLIVEPWRVTEVLERFGPTSIELSDKTTLLPVARWARRQGIGTVLLSHERLDEMFAMRTGLETGAKVSIKLLNRLLVRNVDRIVVTSRYAQREFTKLTASVDCRLDRVPLGVDHDAFRPRPRAADDDRIRLVLAGRLSREKSPALAVGTAMELHRRGVPVQLDVYGDGPHRAELVDLSRGGPVTFHGHVGGREDLSRRLATADVALSVCPGETFGLAVLEALASGTPVVTANRGGARELVDETCGAWADPEPGALADAVLELAGRPIARTRDAARARALGYPWEASVARMLEVHADLSAVVEPASA